MLGRIVVVVVDPHDDCNVLLLGGGADDDLLRACAQVLSRPVALRKEAGRLQHDIDIQIFPREFGRVAFRQNLHALPAHRHCGAIYGDAALVATVDRIVLEQVCEGCGVCEVVDRYHLDILGVFLQGSKDVPTNAAEPVDSDPNRHVFLVRCSVLPTVKTKHLRQADEHPRLEGHRPRESHRPHCSPPR